MTESKKPKDADGEHPAPTKGSRTQSESDTWRTLTRSDSMLRLADTIGVKLSESLLRLFACDCAESVLPTFEKKHPEDRRPRRAIDVARHFANGETTQEAMTAAAADALLPAEAARSVAGRSAEAEEAAMVAKRAAEAECGRTQRVAEAAIFEGRGDMLTATEAFKAANDAANAAAANAEATMAAAGDAMAIAGAALAAMSAAMLPAKKAAGDAVIAAEGSARGAAVAAIYAASAPSKGTARSLSIDLAVNAARSWQADRLRFYFPDPFGPEEP